MGIVVISFEDGMIDRPMVDEADMPPLAMIEPTL